MCASDLNSFIAALPKCEHHVHIEGCLSPPLEFTLAQRNNITLPATEDASFASAEALQERYNRFTSLDDFLHYYYIGMNVLIRESDFYDLAMEYFRRARSDGVRHAEIFFDPQAHTSRGIKLSDVVSALSRAADDAFTTLGLSAHIIPCFLRHLPQQDAIEHLQMLKPDLQSGKLLAVGLDSSEKGFPPEMFKDVYAQAKALGVRRTAHAGEEGGPDAIRDALKHLDVMRIDHGVAMAQDPELMKELAERQTLVTVCPVSNIQLRVFETIEQVPIRKLLEHGVRFSINSDDPAYFGAWTLDCYYAVQKAHNLSKQEWVTIARNSIEGSWCSDERKEELKGLLGEVAAA